MSQNTLTLFELNKEIKETLTDRFPDFYWVKAEVANVKVNSNGHCFLELIEKDKTTDKIIAQARATIWAFTYRLIRPYFESTTGKSLTRGIKILFNAGITYHEMYGLSLDIKDIDPAYTIGDLEQRKQEIIQKLQNEGVINLNKELKIPLCPQRIAVISSAQAAGYEDFVNQLQTNVYGYAFSVRLFAATMQGEKAEASIIRALEQVYEQINNFDIVALIRGGGSQSDLSCYNNYMLAYNIAQFPMPVITGIGHDRDDTIADMVSHIKLKTPTAVADFLINKLAVYESEIESLSISIQRTAQTLLQRHNNKINQYSFAIKDHVKSFLFQHELNLQDAGNELTSSVKSYFLKKRTHLSARSFDMSQKVKHKYSSERMSIKILSQNISRSIHTFFLKQNHCLELAAKSAYLSNPERILEKGYSITLKNGKLVKSTQQVLKGDEITTFVKDGSFKSKIDD